MIIILSILTVILTATGQVFLKMGALLGKRLIFNNYVMLGYSIFIIVVCLTVILMNYLPLKYISIIISFSYPTTAVFAAGFLGERISINTIISCLVVVFGCIVFNL